MGEIKIESFEDKSGNKNHAVQPEVSKQPFDGDFIKLKQAVIERIHNKDCPNYDWVVVPITLSRVLQALEKTDMYGGVYELNASETSWWLKFKQYSRVDKRSRFQIDTAWIEWKLLKEDKSTATLEDQSEETIEALTKIFLSN